jgi:predicted nucleic acid-binding protein
MTRILRDALWSAALLRRFRSQLINSQLSSLSINDQCTMLEAARHRADPMVSELFPLAVDHWSRITEPMVNCLLDTGPLVALLDRSEPDHQRVQSSFARLRGVRLVTTGAVITEAFYFLSDVRDGPANLASFLDTSATEVRDSFTPDALAAAVRLMGKYADIPMDFPDATLVWIAESSGTDKILTLDRRGFSSFRFGKNRRFELLLDV